MELKQLKSKRKRLGDEKLKLPLKSEKEIIGVFNGVSVVIHDWHSMNYLYEEGCFGKGSFSKREPNYHTKKDDIPKIVFAQQLENQSRWKSSFKYVCPDKYFTSRNAYELSARSVEKFLASTFDESAVEHPVNDENPETSLIFSDSNSDEESQNDKLKSLVSEILQSRQGRKLNNSLFKAEDEVIILNPVSHTELPSLDALKPRIEHEAFLPEENLNLNLEEALYLKSVLGCLTVTDLEKKNLTSHELWEKFKGVDENFVGRYVTYHHFRSKGWIVRSGVKFGGDYLLYKIGPAQYHSSYLIKVLNEKKLSWRELLSYNRLAETFHKEVVFVNVSFCQTESGGKMFPEVLKNFIVEETVISRWFPSRERKAKNVT